MAEILAVEWIAWLFFFWKVWTALAVAVASILVPLWVIVSLIAAIADARR